MAGPAGKIDARESIAGMRNVVDRVRLADSGGYRRYNGETIAF